MFVVDDIYLEILTYFCHTRHKSIVILCWRETADRSKFLTSFLRKKLVELIIRTYIYDIIVNNSERRALD